MLDKKNNSIEKIKTDRELNSIFEPAQDLLKIFSLEPFFKKTNK